MQSNAKNKKESEEKFKEVQEAYDILSDATKRGNYDQFGHAGVGTAGPPPNGDPFDHLRRGAPRGKSGWKAGPNVTVEDFDLNDFANQGDFSSIFEQLFGGRVPPGGAGPGRRGPAQARPRPEPQRGENVEHSVTITFEQAARGGSLPLQINRDGKLETIDIKIPAGVKDGSKIRIRGRGQQVGAEPGDLIIITRVRPHEFFRRDGLDVLLDLPLSLYEALLGTKVSVPTLDGPVTLTVGPDTPNGGKLRVKGRGAERGEEKGDQLCIVKIVLPKDLDDEDREAVRQMAVKHPLNARADSKW